MNQTQEAFRDSKEDVAAQDAIKSRALRSLSILEKSFIRRGSGRYIVLCPNAER